MNQALSELDNLHTIVETHSSRLSKYVVAFQYGPPEESSSRDDIRVPKKQRRLTDDDRQGRLSITVGVDDAWWWGTSVDGSELKALTTMSGNATPSSPSSSKSVEPTDEQARRFVDKILGALKRQSIMIGMKKSARAPDGSVPSIKLYIDVEQGPIQIKLDKLDDRSARIRSTGILLSSTLYPRPSTTASNQTYNDVDSISSIELSQLQRKLETTQQALREERHKYRSLLAAPSAANVRTGRRPVVGLGPAAPASGSQRSQLVSRAPPSSPTRSSSRSGLPSSSSGSSRSGRIAAAAPSSDDLGSLSGDVHERPSQRTLSLVNPTRARRADPRDNDGFVGDDDE